MINCKGNCGEKIMTGSKGLKRYCDDCYKKINQKRALKRREYNCSECGKICYGHKCRECFKKGKNKGKYKNGNMSKL